MLARRNSTSDEPSKEASSKWLTQQDPISGRAGISCDDQWGRHAGMWGRDASASPGLNHLLLNFTKTFCTRIPPRRATRKATNLSTPTWQKSKKITRSVKRVRPKTTSLPPPGELPANGYAWGCERTTSSQVLRVISRTLCH